MLSGLFGLVFGNWLNTTATSKNRPDIVDRIKRELLDKPKTYGEPINILLIGSDSRSGENARSDTLILMNVNYKKRRIYFVSIPRDMRVYIPKRGNQKINAAYAYGQASLSIATVEDFLGVDLNHYIEVDFKGFKKLVDALGGIDIDVKNQINDRSWQYRMYIPKGRQRMNGDTALNYVRYRHGDSDFERASRQQEFLKALVTNIFSSKAILKLPQLIDIINENVGTDMTKGEMLSLGGFMRAVPGDRLENVTLPGRSTMIGGGSYVIPDRFTIDSILENVEAGRSVKSMASPGESGKVPLKLDGARMTLLNGSGQIGLARRARSRLAEQGFYIAKVGDATTSDYRKTEIRYTLSRQNEASAMRRFFFKKATTIMVDESESSDTFEIILGNDYWLVDQKLTKVKRKQNGKI